MSPEISNPESKVGTLNPKTFESGKFCHVNTYLSNLDNSASDILTLQYTAVSRKVVPQNRTRQCRKVLWVMGVYGI